MINQEPSPSPIPTYNQEWVRNGGGGEMHRNLAHLAQGICFRKDEYPLTLGFKGTVCRSFLGGEKGLVDATFPALPQPSSPHMLAGAISETLWLPHLLYLASSCRLVQPSSGHISNCWQPGTVLAYLRCITTEWGPVISFNRVSCMLKQSQGWVQVQPTTHHQESWLS